MQVCSALVLLRKCGVRKEAIVLTCASLGSGVGIGRFKAGGFSAAIGPAHAGLTIYLISTDCNEATNATVDTSCLQQDMGPIGVVDGESQAVAKGVVDMGLFQPPTYTPGCIPPVQIVALEAKKG